MRWNLYKYVRSLHNARQGQNLHFCGARPLECPGAGFGGGPGGQDVIDDKDIAARHQGRFRNPEGALHIAAPSLGGIHGALALGGPGTLQRTDRQGPGCPPRQGAGQLRSLVVAPPSEPEAMQRHRHDQIGICQKGPAAALQPMGEARHQFQPVRMLQRQNGPAAGLVVN